MSKAKASRKRDVWEELTWSVDTLAAASRHKGSKRAGQVIEAADLLASAAYGVAGMRTPRYAAGRALRLNHLARIADVQASLHEYYHQDTEAGRRTFLNGLEREVLLLRDDIDALT